MNTSDMAINYDPTIIDESNDSIVMRKTDALVNIVFQKYVNMSGLSNLLDIALMGANRTPLRKNVILWGPGGYGKSEFTLEYIQALTGIKPFVINMHKEMTTNELYGGIHIPTMQSGSLKYAIRNSFMNHKIVILEEGLDAPDGVLLSLKNILTSREFNNGGQVQRINTMLVIINTNHDPARFNSDLSKQALMERFPYVSRVDWSNVQNRYELYEYLVNHTLANGRNPIVSSDYARLIANIAESETWSPRRLIHVVHALQDAAASNSRYNNIDLDAIDMTDIITVSNLFGFNTSRAMDEMRQKDILRIINIKHFEFGNEVNEMMAKINDARKNVNGGKVRSINALRQIIRDTYMRIDAMIVDCNELLNSSRDKKGNTLSEAHDFYDSMLRQLDKLKDHCNKTWEQLIIDDVAYGEDN